MNSDETMLAFISSLKTGDISKTVRTVQTIDKNVTDFYELKVKEVKQQKKEDEKEAKHKRRLAQLEKRKDQENRKKEGKGILSKLFKGKEKKEGSNMAAWLLAGLGIAAAGTWVATSQDPAAKKIRDEIDKKVKEGVEFLKPKLQEAIDKGVNAVKKQILKFTDEMNRKAKVTDKQEIETEEAEGTIQEKIQGMRQEQKGLTAWDSITGRAAELEEQIYRLEAGETMSYAPDFRKGGGAGKKGRGIVSGDVVTLMQTSSGEDRKNLQTLDKLIRDRRRINDALANAKTEEARKRISGMLVEKDDIIGKLLEDNDKLTKQLMEVRNIRYGNANNPVGRQVGGPIIVPGYGDGDKIPMLLPEGSFVLNREASKTLRFQEGGVVAAEHKHREKHIMDYARSQGIRGKELASFMGQMAHESGNFKYHTEVASGKKYEGRKDLGNTQPGDGPLYKGRGYIQITGRWNYNHYGKRLGVDLINNPELASSPEVASKIAVMYWKDRVNRKAASAGNVSGTTRGINPGLKGLEDRQVKTARYMKDPRMNQAGPKIVGKGKVGQKIVGTGNAAVDFVRGLFGGPKVGDVVQPKPVKRQMGGPVNHAKQRLDDNHDKLLNEIAQGVEPPVVIVKRRARPKAQPDPGGAGVKTSRGNQLNIVEVKTQLHRLTTGANY